MTDKNWKRWERTLAKKYNAERNPVSGRSRGYKGDVENEELNIEVKYHKDGSPPKWLTTALDQADAAVEYNDERPNAPSNQLGVAYFKWGKERFVVMRVPAFDRLYQEFGSWVKT